LQGGLGLDYFVNLFGDVEQKYQNSTQLRGWTAGVLCALLVNLPAIGEAAKLAGVITTSIEGHYRARSLDAGVNSYTDICQLWVRSP